MSTRDDLIDYVKSNLTKDFKSTSELPWTKDKQALYLKNFKYIYVDRPQTEQEPLYDGLDGSGAVLQTTTSNIYIATDSKQLPKMYDEQVRLIKRARNDEKGVNQKLALVSTEYVGDALVTTIELAHTQTILNE